MHDRFLIDSESRTSQLEHDRDEEVCIKMDEVADKDFSHYRTQSECFRYEQNWWISLKKCEGCLVVGCDHGPQAEVAQGGWSWTSR